MASGEHFDIAHMTEAAEAPKLNCSLVEEAFAHLAEQPLARQFSVLQQIEQQNAGPLKPGEQRGARLSAHINPDEESGGSLITLIRNDMGGYNDQSIFSGIFVNHKLTELRICGKLQPLPPESQHHSEARNKK